MKQQYFIVVVAHSIHGRIRRIHIPHQVVYLVIGLAILGSFSLFGMMSSYMRMAWKVANYNSLRSEVESLRARYQRLQKDADQTSDDLAKLQLFASEVSIAYGIRRTLEGPADIASEGRLIPTLNETLQEYNMLKSANFSRFHRTYARRWQTNTQPSLWPVNGRLMSRFGAREDPFHGGQAFHAGVDISAPTGTAVRATADGIVTVAEWAGAYGRLIVVDHGRGVHTYYAHLSRIDVLSGQEVRRGEIIGAVGASGRVTSPHLHYEVRMRGTPVNPYNFLSKSTIAMAERKDFPF